VVKSFLATAARAIIDVEQAEIVIRSKEDFLTYKVSKQRKYLKNFAKYDEKEDGNLTAEDYDMIRLFWMKTRV